MKIISLIYFNIIINLITNNVYANLDYANTDYNIVNNNLINQSNFSLAKNEDKLITQNYNFGSNSFFNSFRTNRANNSNQVQANGMYKYADGSDLYYLMDQPKNGQSSPFSPGISLDYTKRANDLYDAFNKYTNQLYPNLPDPQSNPPFYIPKFVIDNAPKYRK